MVKDRQLAIPLPHRPAWGREDFLATPANRAAMDMIERWPGWPGPVLILTGPPGSGKTHLAQIWRAAARAAPFPPPGGDPLRGRPCLFDNADRIQKSDQQTLLHLINHVQENRSSLLLTGRRPPGHWPLDLPDLRSRIRALPVVSLPPPDDDLITALLVKLFADRQLAPAPAVIAYLAARMERSAARARELVAALDHAALARGAPVTIPLARKILDRSGGPLNA